MSISYKNEIPTIEELEELYQSVGWENYGNGLDKQQAYKNSLCVLCAREEGKLVGVVRVVGDGVSIIYVQDVIVHPKYQRNGIGKAMFQKMEMLFEDVYQKVLITDNLKERKDFYKSLGYSTISENHCCTFIKVNLEKKR